MKPNPFTTPAPRGGTVTLSEILDRVSAHAEGDGWVAHCPAHEDSHPSLRVAYNADTRAVLLKCRAGCGIDDVLAEVDLEMSDLFNVEPGDLSNVRSVETEADGPSEENLDALAEYVRLAASRFAGSPAAGYAKRRFGVCADKAADLELGFDDGTLSVDGMHLSVGLFHDAPRLIVPFRDAGGAPHYMQGRSLTPKARAKWSGPTNPRGRSWPKYGILTGGTGWNEVIITEGPGDGLVAASVGYDTVLVRGASLFGSQSKLADELVGYLTDRVAVVAGDADEAGQRFNREAAKALSSRGVPVRQITLPEGMGDLGEWFERTLNRQQFNRDFIAAVKRSVAITSDDIVAAEISAELAHLFSDVSNAQMLRSSIREGGGDVRYAPEVGFIVYRPELGTWTVDSAEWSRSQAQDLAPLIMSENAAIIRAMTAKLATITDETVARRAEQAVEAARRKSRSNATITYIGSTRGIDSMLRELRALPGVYTSLDKFDSHPDLLAVGNGVLNLQTGTLTPYSEETRELYLMRRVSTDYRADAHCPRWEEFLAQIFPENRDLVDYMQRLVGYGITGHTVEQCLAVLYGVGSNGKGVLIETLTSVFDGITKTTPFSTFERKQSAGIPNDIAALAGSRMVMASEGEQGKPMAEALIKRLTGGDTISARFMHREFFEFRPAFLIMLATNYRPTFRGQDWGLWRRVRMIPFVARFDKRKHADPYLSAKLRGDAVPASAYLPGEDYGDGPAGILAWAVRGAMTWYREGLQEPPVVDDVTDELRRTSDALAPFYAEHLIHDADSRITGKRVWELYRQWADDENLPAKDVWKRSTVWAALEERGAIRKTHQGQAVFNGIRERRPTDPFEG